MGDILQAVNRFALYDNIFITPVIASRKDAEARRGNSVVSVEPVEPHAKTRSREGAILSLRGAKRRSNPVI
ncbi:MAG: hypothetical protein FWF38_05170 [Spirochaetaceae bacterium]|nr:hypothetical protein [Spirochaetaceae bacterium]